jgi:transcriptional regulator with XRE-family HTH domain
VGTNHTAPVQDFAGAFKSFRTAEGVSLEQASAYLGVPASTIAGWEAGVGNPRGRGIDEVAHLMGVTRAKIYLMLIASM